MIKSEGPGNEKIPCAGARGARDLLTCSTDRVLTVHPGRLVYLAT